MFPSKHEENILTLSETLSNLLCEKYAQFLFQIELNLFAYVNIKQVFWNIALFLN